MYAWKCWRETRARFFILLTMSLVCAGLYARVFFGPGAVGLGNEPYEVTPENVTLLLRLYSMVMIVYIGWITIVGGFFLGATGMGGEMENGTAEYLWTRPHTRRSLFLQHWLVCASELIAVSLVPTLLILLIAGVHFGAWKLWRFPLAASLQVLPGILFLGLTILMVAIRRSAASGLIFSLGITFGYLGLTYYAIHHLKLHAPGEVIPGAGDWTAQYVLYSIPRLTPRFPWAATIGMGLLSIAFTVAADRLIKRAEI
jgi:ABC-type transport system involved in multi-copper enzyme maturation permease subunit